VLAFLVELAACSAGIKQQPDGGSGAAGTSGPGVAGTSGGGTTGTAGTGHPGCDGAATCALRVPEGCGDGINNQGGIEQCDDGNTIAGDGCNGACQIEPNWTCPPAGKCTRSFRCGDGVVNPGEVCDDGNTNDGDGCNSTCTVQDPGWACTTAGQPCVKTSVCGNKRVEPGETCDDGNTKAGDGCSASCIVESGYVCTAPGSPCTKAARCGDGIVNVNLGEVCDDGNTADGDGCSADCMIVGAGCSCVPGKLCVCPQVKCGNGTVEGTETCDDGNTTAGDGCSATCQLEKGYGCPLRNAPCIPVCGDGMVIGTEQCDPGVKVTNMNLACSSTCRWNPGWACTGSPPTECHATTCGDGKKEGAEACDDGNTLPYDGCSSTCQVEPNCTGSTGACTGKCGDGIILGGEACDDGNNISGDGCSATCTLEAGFTCTRPPLGDHIDVPIVYRDFRAHMPADFEPGATGQSAAVTGLVANTLNAAGKPTFAAANNTGYINSATTFAQWYTDVPGTNHTTATTIRLCNSGGTAGTFVNRWGPNCEQWPVTTMAYYCGNVGSELTDTYGNPIPCTSKFGATDCDKLDAMAGYKQISCTASGGNWTAIYQTGALDGTPLFFPIDADTFTPLASAERVTATIPPPYAVNWPAETPAKTHNFSFTSEVRYWFPYDSTKSYKLDFLGDDDVWLFVNKRLAVDLGGIHVPVQGSVTISAANAATYGMTNGNVYEVEVFQAERQTNGSSYKLTLSGFNSGTSACGPTCGDAVVTAPEQCDNGTAKNTGGYNACTADCKLGPYCGDGHVDSGNEECDNGKNTDAYGTSGGCGPGCKLPVRCGDGLVQFEYGETCDDGVNDGSYGGCTAQCQRAPYCGDGKVQKPQEACDDGANDGTYNTCGDPTMPLPNCQLGPRCGDGIVQDAYGEQCEPTSSNDPNCTVACKKPGICGDGVVQAPEQCDYGETMNNGAYGGCSPGCVLAPHCGDGIKNGPEECDDGVNDNSYGGCSGQCKLAPHCGDGHTDTGYEQCDDGANNGPTDACSVTCKFNVQ
jgi:fibro-slime domain-containing protein